MQLQISEYETKRINNKKMLQKVEFQFLDPRIFRV